MDRELFRLYGGNNNNNQNEYGFCVTSPHHQSRVEEIKGIKLSRESLFGNLLLIEAIVVNIPLFCGAFYQFIKFIKFPSIEIEFMMRFRKPNSCKVKPDFRQDWLRDFSWWWNILQMQHHRRTHKHYVSFTM